MSDIQISIAAPNGAPVRAFAVRANHPLLPWLVTVSQFPAMSESARACLRPRIIEAARHYFEKECDDWEPRNLGWDYIGLVEDGFAELRRVGGPAALKVLHPLLALLMGAGLSDDEIADLLSPRYARVLNAASADAAEWSADAADWPDA